jgi:hypothetical protein
MRKRSGIVLFSFLILWTILTIATVTWGIRYDFPDNVHIDYGFPIVWATQTLSTIVGPVNLWAVDTSALITNLVLWLGIMIVATAGLLYILNKKDSDK